MPLVLVVDDMADNREMYMEYLCFAGFRVAGAESGEAAVEIARRRRPSVILLDMSLPGMDGWETTRILKSDPRTRAIAVIAVTGHAESTYRLRAFEAGCAGFVAKPSLPQDIARLIRGVLYPSKAAAGS
jgi:CheY-like chemotaxis protein